MPVNEITASKAEYALVLTALGLKVQTSIPERFVPPVVVITPSGQYLEPISLANNKYMMKLDLMVVASNAVNAKATEALDAAIAKILLGNPNWCRINSVGQPYSLEVNNAQYLSANIAVEFPIEI